MAANQTDGQTQDQAPGKQQNQEPGRPIVSLRNPVWHGKEEVRQLQLRKPRAGDLRGVKLSVGEHGVTIDFASLLDLASNLSAQPPSVLDQLDLDDAVEVAMAVAPLLPARLQTLTKS